MLLLLFCYFPKLKPTILACRVANHYLTQVPHIYLLVIMLSILLLAMWACCILSMLYLFSTATFVVGSEQDVFTSVQSYAQHGLVLLYYLIFGVFGLVLLSRVWQCLFLLVPAVLGTMAVGLIHSLTTRSLEGSK